MQENDKIRKSFTQIAYKAPEFSAETTFGDIKLSIVQKMKLLNELQQQE